MKQIVAIDGPSGAGKSTVSRELAKRLGYVHLDTGAMYRTVALAAIRSGVEMEDEIALDALCDRIRIKLVDTGSGIKVNLDGEDVSELIRSPEMSLASSAVSGVSSVRRHMVRLQREMGSCGGMVAEGRDMGTVVFPDTRAKFYLDASVGERALRRWLELGGPEARDSLDKVEEDMRERDHNDSTRADSPLRLADDAVVVDTTDMSPDEVVDLLFRRVKELEKKP
ncbi:MAG TPA: (d)CMP kinase [Proteobacteria bacterium]|nr:cytidylate kinase [bacterium BMS3Abin14]HDL53834.1 (d)CMP kinase [Pseudomonadota bacterium]